MSFVKKIQTLSKIEEDNTVESVTLPRDWPVRAGDKVTMLFDRYLLLISSKSMEEAGREINKAILRLVFQDSQRNQVKSNED